VSTNLSQVAGRALAEKLRVEQKFGPSDEKLEEEFDAAAEKNRKNNDESETTAKTEAKAARKVRS
jgi:hypothetical protein